jgi:hypothetical protein
MNSQYISTKNNNLKVKTYKILWPYGKIKINVTEVGDSIPSFVIHFLLDN